MNQYYHDRAAPRTFVEKTFMKISVRTQALVPEVTEEVDKVKVSSGHTMNSLMTESGGQTGTFYPRL